jgi:hypothetical protein
LNGRRTGAAGLIPVIGESHADAFLGAYVEDAAGVPLAFATVAHVNGLRTHQFLSADGRIHPKIVIALEILRLLGPIGTQDPRALPDAMVSENLFNPEWANGWFVNPVMAEAPLLFVVGEVNARFLYKEIPKYADIQVPFDPSSFARVPRFTPTALVSGESVNAAVRAQLMPMFRAFELLREAGLKNIALHSISPCTADDERYLAEIQYDTYALTRYKVIMLFNDAMRAFCAQARFMFVDRWDDFTEGGLVRDGYMADAVHVNNERMRESLIRLYELVETRRQKPQEPASE